MEVAKAMCLSSAFSEFTIWVHQFCEKYSAKAVTPTELGLGHDFAERRGWRKTQRAAGGLGRQRPNKEGTHVGKNKNRELAFGESRSENKPSKPETSAQKLCSFRSTKSC